MLIEFDTVRRSSEETYNRDIQSDTTGEASVPFHRQYDYKTQVTIDMDNIRDFTAGRVYFNEQCYECVYAYEEDGTQTNNLLISYEDFKRVFEYAKGIKIIRHEEV
jgi:hypothetical protein